MKKLMQLKLKYLAKMILRKYQPEIIGVTGSVGKTSTKEAIYQVLKKEKRVRQSKKNYNNEFGLPLTIIGAVSPAKNLFAWFAIGFKVLKMLLIKDKNYPEILILEMGIDRPGDMDYLNSIAKCRVGVVTAVGLVHVQYFKNKNALQKEKAKLIKNVLKDGWSIINYDDEATRNMINMSRARVISYGLDERAMLRASDIAFNYSNQEVQGINFKIHYQGSSVPVHIPKAWGQGAVYAALAGAGVGLSYNMNLHDISRALQKYHSPRGRLNLIAGIKQTTLIDDTYNAEPKSMKLAIQVLADIANDNKVRKLAALGDMLELGVQSEKKHREIGALLVQRKIDKLYTVGERARDIARGAREAGMKEENIFMFDDSFEAGKFIQKRIKKNDCLLVKGSQGIRMEKIILELMAEPMRAKELLIRQEDAWQKS